jgi:hypothetical protein
MVEQLSTCRQPTGPSASRPATDDVNFAAACRVGFAGFLRPGEFTYTAADAKDPTTFAATRLTRNDVRFAVDSNGCYDHARLTLKRSKTDREHEGVNSYLQGQVTPPAR